MTKAIFEHLDALAAAHSAAKAIDLVGAVTNPPTLLRPGAEKYFAENI